MLTRFHKILIGVLVAQIALAVILMTRSDTSAALIEKPLLPAFDPAKVTRVQVFAPNQPKAIDLAKRGADWVLASHFDYPVQAQKVTDMLAPLGKLAAAEPLATQAGRHKQLRVGDTEFERKIVISGNGPDLTLYVGTGARRTPVRIGSDARVYGVTGLQAFSFLTEANQYVDTAYVSLAADEVTKLTVQRGASKFELERVAAPAAGSGSGSGSAAPTESWKVLVDGAAPALAAGESIDTDAITQLVSKVAQLHMMAPGDPKRSAAQPTATVTIQRKTAAPLILDLVADGEAFWVAERGRGKAAMVDKAIIGEVVNLTRDKLVKQPAPKGAGSAAGSASPPIDFDPSQLEGLPGMPME
ncbi:MAG: DUF4340 domain-containing protein [Kofleriaceae bacterium]